MIRMEAILIFEVMLFPRTTSLTEKTYFLGPNRWHCLIEGTWSIPTLLDLSEWAGITESPHSVSRSHKDTVFVIPAHSLASTIQIQFLHLIHILSFIQELKRTCMGILYVLCPQQSLFSSSILTNPREVFFFFCSEPILRLAVHESPAIHNYLLI